MGERHLGKTQQKEAGKDDENEDGKVESEAGKDDENEDAIVEKEDGTETEVKQLSHSSSVFL